MIEVVEEKENKVIIEEVVADNIKEKKPFKILGFSIWGILAYFVIYSVIGFIVETSYGVITKGILESRRSVLYGPFCTIYGLGAVIMIIFLQYFSKNNNSLFIGGFIIGSVVEYFVSLIGEILFSVKWWDYSHMPLNINGRICVFFSLFWGFLAIYLISYLNPRVDKLILNIKKKVPYKLLKSLTTGFVVFLFLNILITGYALQMFFIRIVEINDINLEENIKEVISESYDKIYGNKEYANIVYKFFGDEKMLKTFPNLKIQDKDGNIIYIDMLFPDIQPYYIKIFENNNRHIFDIQKLKIEESKNEKCVF